MSRRDTNSLEMRFSAVGKLCPSRASCPEQSKPILPILSCLPVQLQGPLCTKIIGRKGSQSKWTRSMLGASQSISPSHVAFVPECKVALPLGNRRLSAENSVYIRRRKAIGDEPTVLHTDQMTRPGCMPRAGSTSHGRLNHWGRGYSTF
jgi:hypothetical protein